MTDAAARTDLPLTESTYRTLARGLAVLRMFTGVIC
jgi:hypothetical protein